MKVSLEVLSSSWAYGKEHVMKEGIFARQSGREMDQVLPTIKDCCAPPSCFVAIAYVVPVFNGY